MAASGAFVLGAVLGCGAASQPRAAEPEAARAEPKASSPADWVELRNSQASEPSPASEPPSESAEAETGAKIAAHEAQHERARSAAAVLKALTQPGVVFMVEYSLTDAYQRAQETCLATAGDDEAKRAECPAKVRQSFAADVIRFREDENGRLWWIVYKRQGDELIETHSSRVELDANDAGSVTMTTLGQPKGKRPLFKGAQRMVFNVPNEYSIEIRDPELGQLVYDAKVGLVR